MSALVLGWVEGCYAVCRLPPDAETPGWAGAGTIHAVVRTPEELSLVCDAGAVPPEIEAERDFACFRVRGRLDFALTGILSAIASVLADAQVSLFALSTFDTDYVLVRRADVPRARAALEAAGHRFEAS